MGRHAAVHVSGKARTTGTVHDGPVEEKSLRSGVERPTVVGGRRAAREGLGTRAAAVPAPAVKRIAQPVVQAPAASFRRPVFTGKRIVLPLVGFAATFAFISGSLINPLSGAYAATASDATIAPATVGHVVGQNYTVSATSAVSATRDGYAVHYTPPVVAKPKVVATTPTTDDSATTATTSTSTSASTATTAAPAAAAPDPGSAQAIGAKLVAAKGWGTDQYNCLVSLWNKESGWNVYASNPSGAYGIPQALPGSKMSSAGADWATSATTQITWGLGYIQGSYGTPCGAWAHSVAYNWY